MLEWVKYHIKEENIKNVLYVFNYIGLIKNATRKSNLID